jgi:phosphopentomutase
VRIWPDEPFDPMPFQTAIEYLKTKEPRVLFLGLGETDDWAHAGSYAEYLNAAHLADDYLRQIWELVQSMPEYRGKTTLIVLPDHGRGAGAKWTDHGEKIPESMQTWMAFLGPDTRPLGERKQAQPVTESEIAATLAALLGEDYHTAVPQAGTPIPDVLPK